MEHFHKQRGGTLLGLVIGLVAGLGIAVVVALLITKSSAPFNSKNDKPEKSANPSATQSADPNLPLYRNREAVKEAAKEFVKEADIGKISEPGSAAKAETQSAADKTAAANTKEAAGKAEGHDSYYLQAGAFKSSVDAENMRARLALLGFEAGISETISQNGTLYRVRIGPFTQTEPMNRIRGKLKENGVSADVIRIPK